MISCQENQQHTRGLPGRRPVVDANVVGGASLRVVGRWPPDGGFSSLLVRSAGWVGIQERSQSRPPSGLEKSGEEEGAASFKMGPHVEQNHRGSQDGLGKHTEGRCSILIGGCFNAY